MKIIQARKLLGKDWEYQSTKMDLKDPLVLVFADRLHLEKQEIIDEINEEFAYEDIVFASTAGEISGNEVIEDSIAVTAIEFEKSTFVVKSANILDFDNDAKVLGSKLIDALPKDDLKHVFVLLDGYLVHASALISGMESGLDGQMITGGKCSDGSRFQKTLAAYNETPKEGEVIIVGFYGKSLEISFASYGGWIPFGPERAITKCKGNVLYEFDNRPALEIYTDYLGDRAKELPNAAITYPLNITEKGKGRPVVRSIVSVDQTNNSIALMEDITLNSKAQLMMASVDGIVAGAHEAANLAMKNRKKKPQVAIVISCSGRKSVMNQRVEEEIEEIGHVFGEDVLVTGFYSGGELAPFYGETSCELHNQTMTLTLISE